MKKYRIVSRGRFKVYILRASGDMEHRYFRSWFNAYHYFRMMVSFCGHKGGSIYYDDGGYRCFPIVTHYNCITVWGDL